MAAGEVQYANNYVVSWSGLRFVCPSEVEAPPAEEADALRRGEGVGGVDVAPLCRKAGAPNLRSGRAMQANMCAAPWSGESKTSRIVRRLRCLLRYSPRIIPPYCRAVRLLCCFNLMFRGTDNAWLCRPQ